MWCRLGIREGRKLSLVGSGHSSRTEADVQGKDKADCGRLMPPNLGLLSAADSTGRCNTLTIA